MLFGYSELKNPRPFSKWAGISSVVVLFVGIYDSF